MSGLRLSTFTTCFFLSYLLTCGEQKETNITCKLCHGYQVCGDTNYAPFCEGLPCTKEQYESCIKSFTEEFTCDIPGLFVSLRSPSEYYECSFYINKPKMLKKVKMCPPRKEFCPYTMRCLAPEEKEIVTVLLTTYKKQKFKKTDFTCTEPGIYSDDFDCKKYYLCETDQGTPSVFSCKVHTYFDKISKLCLSHLSVNCANNLRRSLKSKTSDASELYEEVQRRIKEKQKLKIKLYKYMRWIKNIPPRGVRKRATAIVIDLLKNLDNKLYRNSSHIEVLEQRVREMEKSLKKIASYIGNANKNLESLLQQIAHASMKTTNTDLESKTFTFNKHTVLNANDNVSNQSHVPPCSLKTTSDPVLTETEVSSGETIAQRTQKSIVISSVLASEPFATLHPATSTATVSTTTVTTEPLTATNTHTEQVVHKFSLTNNTVASHTEHTTTEKLINATAEFETISPSNMAEISKIVETAATNMTATAPPAEANPPTVQEFKEFSPVVRNNLFTSQTESTTEAFIDLLIDVTFEFETTPSPNATETNPITETTATTAAPFDQTNPPTIQAFKEFPSVIKSNIAASQTESTTAEKITDLLINVTAEFETTLSPNAA